MATLIEETYCKIDNNWSEICDMQIKDLSYFEKVVLDIHSFSGYQHNSVYDVYFINRFPLQLAAYKWRFLKNAKNSN